MEHIEVQEEFEENDAKMEVDQRHSEEEVFDADNLDSEQEEDEEIDEAKVLPHLEPHKAEYGERNLQWLSYLRDIQSHAPYSNRVSHFLDYHESLENPNSMGELSQSVVPYFEFLHAYYCPTSLNTFFAMLKTFFLFTGQGDLDKLAPIVPKRIRFWARSHTTKKSKFFQLPQIGI